MPISKLSRASDLPVTPEDEAESRLQQYLLNWGVKHADNLDQITSTVEQIKQVAESLQASAQILSIPEGPARCAFLVNLVADQLAKMRVELSSPKQPWAYGHLYLNVSNEIFDTLRADEATWVYSHVAEHTYPNLKNKLQLRLADDGWNRGLRVSVDFQLMRAEDYLTTPAE